MRQTENCFQFVVDQPVPGIPDFGVGGLGEKIFYGKPCFSETRGNFIQNCTKDEEKKEKEKRWIFHLDISALDFGGVPIPGLSLLPGGEWHNKKPFLQKGHRPVCHGSLRQGFNSSEVWVLEDHERLLLVDRRGVIRTLRIGYSGVVLSEINSHFLAAYLTRCGVYLTSLEGALWVLKGLEALEKAFRAPLCSYLEIARNRVKVFEAA